jgi:hypothetical protein
MVRGGVAANLDARDLTPPFTSGAMRGGTHVHVFSGDGGRISFTYNDYLVDPEQRNVGVERAGQGGQGGAGGEGSSAQP